MGITTVPSWRLARKAGAASGVIRKDLSFFGGFGKRGVGYNVAFLRKKIGEILGLDQVKEIAWVGAERLMRDPGLLEQLTAHNCRIVAVFDTNSVQPGVHIDDLEVLDATLIRQVVRDLNVDAAVIACPQENAQWAADQLVSAGVKALLNLTGAVIIGPGHVFVRNVDLASELFALSYHCGMLAQR